MTDPRISKLASLLVNYSIGIQPGQQIAIFTHIAADELALAAYTEALKAGGLPYLIGMFPESDEILYRLGSAQQLAYFSPAEQLPDQIYDAELVILARQNTRLLGRVDPDRIACRMKAYKTVNQVFLERAARGDLNWCTTISPTNALAQDAGMSLTDYSELLFSADKLDEPDPVAAWRSLGSQMQQLKSWLAGRDQVVFKGRDIDLRLSIRDRKFVAADGRLNMPDGELFTGPVEDTASGWVRFRYPTIAMGRELSDIELWFEAGRVVKEQAARGQEALTAFLDTDQGSRYLGEWGIGLNYSLTQHTKSILFDEKLGGTIHLAIGSSYPETGGLNESGVHWDLICDMSESEIHIDGDLFYRNGKPLLWGV